MSEMRETVREDREFLGRVEQSIRQAEEGVETELEQGLMNSCKALTNNCYMYLNIIEDAVAAIERVEEVVAVEKDKELEARILEFKEILIEDLEEEGL